MNFPVVRGWFRRQRQRRLARDRAVLFLFLGAAFTVLLVSVTVALESPGRQSLFDTEPDWQAAVPAHWVVPQEAVTALADAELPSYVIGYASSDETGVALLVWDRSLARYAVTDTVPFGEIDVSLRLAVSVRPAAPGEGASPAAAVTVSTCNQALADFFVVRNRDSLRVIEMVDGGGRVHPAVFWHGTLPNGYATFELRDVDADGKTEAVVRGRYHDLTGSGQPNWSSVDVYVWRDGRYGYDKELSWALTTEAAMFPEPSVPEVDTAAPNE